MSNMGYCRFRNTLEDLRDCYEHIYDADLSESEHKARKRLIEIALEIAAYFDEDEIEALEYEH